MEETGKEFLETFPGLEVQGELKDLLSTMEVVRVTMNRRKDLLRVYTVSSQWIHKKYIYQLEEMIKSQLFSCAPIRVKIIERFYLSRQYTPEKLLEVYHSSILLELKNYHILLFHLFRTAQITFPEPDVMELALENSVIAREKEEELYRILDKIFCERCGFHLMIRLIFRQERDEEAIRKSELEMREAARHVAEHTALGETPALEEKETFRKTAASGRGGGKKGSRGKSAREELPLRRSDNPDVLFGRDFEEESTPIDSIEGAVGDIVIRGEILNFDSRELRNGRGLLMFAVTDDTDTIVTKIFVKAEQIPELSGLLKKGTFVKVKGKVMTDAFDHELTVTSVWGIKKIKDFREARHDNSTRKRVELHCHTKMSDMDGVTDAAALVKRAYAWGHPAIAITDHGVVQAFPEANHAMEAIDAEYRAAYQAEHPEVSKEELKKISAPFKVIYGMEAYLVDDLKGIVTDSRGQSLDASFVVFDIETTGFSPASCKIIEIGAVRVEEGRITDRFSTFVNPESPIPFRIENLTGINDNMVLQAPTIDRVLPEFLEFCRGAVMVAHNAGFDMSFIQKNCEDLGIGQTFTVVDTVAMARFLLPGLNRFKLDTVAKALNISLENHHRAVDDAACTAEIFVKFVKMLKERDILDLDALNEQGSVSPNTVRKLPTYHAIILATCETGRVNLYRLVSESHLQYYNRRPRLPKSVFQKYREGLLLGSACEAGELYQALLRGAPEPEISRIVSFYDYLEIQPVGNNAFMIRDENHENINSEEDIREVNRKIVKLGEQFQKPVVATCDVHFMDPKDEIYRRIIMFGKGFDDADQQPPCICIPRRRCWRSFPIWAAPRRRKLWWIIRRKSRICARRSPPSGRGSSRR